jgi:hypothetical protein
MAAIMFAYNITYHHSITSTPFEATFENEPRTSKNPNPNLRKQYGKDLGTEMFQRLRVCQDLTRKTPVKIMRNQLEIQLNIFIPIS